MRRPLALIRSHSLGGLFVAQFLGAANDNLFKNALVVLAVYRLGGAGGVAPAVFSNLAAAAFILPFFLFSAAAGRLADRMDKARLIRWIKMAEVAIMLLAAFGFESGSTWGLLGILALLGLQAALFGPVKYAILPDLLPPDDIMNGNAAIEAGTFVAILIGTIAGGLLIMAPGGPAWVALLLFALAAGGYLAARRVPPVPAADPDAARSSLHLIRETLALLGHMRANAPLFRAALALSWFWLVGVVYLSQMAPFAAHVLNVNNVVVTLFLTLFSLGVGVGSLACARLLKGRISARWVPLAAIALALFSTDFSLAAPAAALVGDAPGGLIAFLATGAAWRVMADLGLAAVAGGFYTVPLYVLLQTHADPAWRARTIAGNNVLNALFMAVGSVAVALLLVAGLPIRWVFLLLAAGCILAALTVCRRLS